MKAFALSAAILATIAAALPTSTLPTPSGVIPSGTPLPSSSRISSTAKQVHSVLTVTDQSKKNVLVELDSGFANLLSGLNLGSVTTSVGTIVQTADSLVGLNIPSDASGLLTVVTSDGEYALVELTDAVESLLSGLGLSLVGNIVGTVVSTLEDIVSSVKRSDLNNVLSITGLNGQIILVQVEPTLLGALNGLDLSSIQGTVGTVVASVPAVSDLASKAQEIGADPTELFGVLSKDGTSALLVKVESTGAQVTSTLSGLLSTLGLSSLTSTIGTVVSSV